jgi:hypothetical protein
VAVADLDELKNPSLSPDAPSKLDLGTPPAMVQTSPEPAHAMQQETAPVDAIGVIFFGFENVAHKASGWHDCTRGDFIPAEVTTKSAGINRPLGRSTLMPQ